MAQETSDTKVSQVLMIRYQFAASYEIQCDKVTGIFIPVNSLHIRTSQTLQGIYTSVPPFDLKRRNNTALLLLSQMIDEFIL